MRGTNKLNTKTKKNSHVVVEKLKTNAHSDLYILKTTKRLVSILQAEPQGITIGKAASYLNTAPSRLAHICEILEGLDFIVWAKNTNVLCWKGASPEIFDTVSCIDGAEFDVLDSNDDGDEL